MSSVWSKEKAWEWYNSKKNGLEDAILWEVIAPTE